MLTIGIYFHSFSNNNVIFNRSISQLPKCFARSGNLQILLFNHSDEEFKIAPGDRIAQLICEKIEYPELQELDTLDETARGAGGFGSTGKN